MLNSLAGCWRFACLALCLKTHTHHHTHTPHTQKFLPPLPVQALEKEAVRRVSWVVRLIQLEAEQRCLFHHSTELAKAAAAACYGCLATDAWGLLEAALNASWEAVAADQGLEREQAEAARDMLHTVWGAGDKAASSAMLPPADV